MRYHLFKKFYEKVVKIKETSFLLSKCKNSIAHHYRFSSPTSNLVVRHASLWCGSVECTTGFESGACNSHVLHFEDVTKNSKTQ